MSNAEFTGKDEQPVIVCAACGQTVPPTEPCDNKECPARTAAELRTAAAKQDFRLGC